jgi:dihydroorotate dehydrogenase electron transfer subunit
MAKEEKMIQEGLLCKELEVLEVRPIPGSPVAHLFLEPLNLPFTPGQFVMLRPKLWGYDPLWPRPFSICDLNSEYLQIFFQVVGKGTNLLLALRPGDKVTCWGPLGQGFPVADRALLLCGGMGIAPFIALCKQHPHPERLKLLFGHRLPLEVYPWQDISDKVEKRASRQESEEELLLFEEELRESIWQYAGKGKIFACGPHPFLKVVHKYLMESKAQGYLSLENRMACGVGACLGCVAKTRQGLVQTCTKGPVFKAEELEL